MCKIILTETQKSKKRKGNCVASGCRNKHAQNRNYCWTCVKRKYAKDNPIRYAYQSLRNNAKTRKKEFDLTFNEFKKFCSKTKILLGRGIQKDSLHIDRIDESKGYTIDNIQVLTNSENVKKIRHYDWIMKYGYTTIIKPDNLDKSDVPF